MHIPLKGQCLEIFGIDFFHLTALSGLIRDILGLLFWFLFFTELIAFLGDSAMLSTPGSQPEILIL